MPSQTQAKVISILNSDAPVFLPTSKATSAISITEMALKLPELSSGASEFLPKNPIAKPSSEKEMVDTVQGTTIFSVGFFSPSVNDVFSSSSLSESRLNIWTCSPRIFPSSK